MTMPCDFTNNIRWGRDDNKKFHRELFASPLNMHRHTNTLHRHMKQHKPTQTLLFYLLPTVILTVIEILLSGLKHHEKFKTVVFRITFIYYPVLFVIHDDQWTPYHNFGIF